ncbi:BamA/OMP85 family outer membrane protein [Pseudochryseolinea flava]|uniref:Outer membrane protein assembly factor BamA n=1 Tax=Pseudochryseolinea flava TaxID=2059302 RepID=A0A364Y7P1_9BACT|nr:POTRA domain-containing protein [Pseudochryseolinea flava]RAW03091.1 outer membrane protein assembly factor BamA [Pseudochryseolinea flava]
MKKFFFLLILLVITADTWAQFRKSRGNDRAASENGLNYASPAEYTIAAIEVTGLNVLDKNAMISLTGLKVGDKIKIPGDAITQAIRNLWKHGLVGDVTIQVDKVEGSDVYLNIVLAERPRLTDFFFTGINKSQESGLKEDLTLIRGKIVNDAMIRNTELAVKKYFVKKGFLNAEVKVHQQKDTLNKDGIRLKIAVNPKSKVKINAISFTGNDHIDDAKLKKKMKGTHERPKFSLHRTLITELFTMNHKEFATSSKPVTWKETKEFINDNIKLNLFVTSKFVQTDYEDDKNKVIEYYNSKGYRDAEIISDTIYAHDNRTINIDFKIHEGPKYYFRNIIWTGNYIYTDKQLNAVLAINKGDVYNNELIQRKITFNPKGLDITGLYMDDGYLFFRIVPVEVAVAGDSIDVEMRISEGEQATINEVSITGNDRTSDHVIRRELSTVPGQKFRRSDIIRTQQKLGQLGYFAPDKIGQNMVPNPANGTVDIEWQVEEQSNDQVELSGGWGGYYGFVGTLGLTFNNFSLRNIPHFENWKPLPVGDGQRLSLRAQANGRSFQSYSFSFTEPWLGGRKPHSLTVSLNSSFQRSLYTTRSNQRLQVHSVTVGLGRLLEWPDNYFTLTNSVSYVRYILDNWYSGLGYNTGASNSVTFNTTLARNSIDNPMYPSSGSTLSLSLTLTPPHSLWRDVDYNTTSDDPNAKAEIYKWIEYHKWMFDAKYYLPLDNKKKLVLEAKAHFGFIGQFTGKAGIGPFERFYLGGDGLAGGFNSFLLGQEVIGLRGYENNVLTPPYFDASRNSDGSVVAGGIVYDKLGLELRYPVTTGNAATIYGFGFVEAGNNWNNYEDFNPFKMYKSAGLGARIFMPAFGLIGLNWAYGFDPVPLNSNRDASGSQFHFTIGQQIR